MKAILVIEMPSKCCNCMFEDGSYCELKEVALDDVFSTEIPNDCPLKPLPQKKNEKDVEEIYLTDARSWTNGFSDGYNYCIDEILGK